LKIRKNCCIIVLYQMSDGIMSNVCKEVYYAKYKKIIKSKRENHVFDRSYNHSDDYYVVVAFSF